MVRHGVEQGPALSAAGAAVFTSVVSAELIGAALFVAASLRLRSALTRLLAGYVILLAETTALTTWLSPFRLVDGTGLEPWQLTRASVLLDTFRPAYSEATARLDRLVPSGSSFGAVVGRDDPSLLL